MRRSNLPHRHANAAGLGDSSGAVLIGLIIGIVLIGTLGVTLHTLSTSETYHTLSANQSMQAHYLAESGYRYLASEYRNAGDIFDKMVRLESLHNAVRTLPNTGGKFDIKIYPYFFITNMQYSAGDNQVAVRTPGEFPSDFALPTTTRIFIENQVYAASLTSQSAPQNVAFQVAVGLVEDVPVNAICCLTATTTNLQTVTAGGSLTLSAGASELFPFKNGYIQIGISTPPIVLSYSRADTIPSGPQAGQTTLYNLQGIDAHSNGSLPLSLSGASDIILKPYVEMVTSGHIGTPPMGASHEIRYAGPMDALSSLSCQ